MEIKIEKFQNINQILEKIPENQNYTLILEDWDEGLIIEENKKGELIKKKISDKINKFASSFCFRVFSEEEEFFWNIYEGVYIFVKDVPEEEIYLEKDLNKYPGVKIINDNNFEKIIIQKILDKNSKLLYLKFKKLQKGEMI